MVSRSTEGSKFESPLSAGSSQARLSFPFAGPFTLLCSFGTMAIDSTEQTLSKLFAPHVESFNYFLEEGLQSSIADLDPVYATFPNQKIIPSTSHCSQIE